MAKVIFGNHCRSWCRSRIETALELYCDILGGKVTRADPERDFVRLGDDFYIAFLYGDVPDQSEFLRSARSVWLEIKSDNVDETRRQILESGLVWKLEGPEPSALLPGAGRPVPAVGRKIDDDLSSYEGAGKARTWRRSRRR